MTQLTQLRVYRPAPSPAAPPSWEWLLTPDNGQGFLEINGTLYKVTEFGFTYDNGAGGRLWKLRKADGTEYQLTQTADADLACDEIAPEIARIHVTEDAVLRGPDPQREYALEQHLADHLFISTYRGYERKWDAASVRRQAEAMAVRLNWSAQRVDVEVHDILGTSTPVGA